MLPSLLFSRLSEFLSTDDIELVKQWFQEKRVTSFRTNLLKSTDAEIENFLRANSIEFRRVSWLPSAFVIDKKDEYWLKGSDIYYSGKIYVQGLASQIPPHFLGLEKWMKVLDVTAAPGSKTSQISALLENTGEVVACEKHQIRYDKLVHNLKLQDCTNVATLKMEAEKLETKYENGHFDAILLDAPCSVEGRIYEPNEKSYGFWTTANITRNSTAQWNLIEKVLPLLKWGGVFVYSTCTLAPEENEAHLARILKRYPGQFELEKAWVDSLYSREGIEEFEGKIFWEEMKKTLRLLPSRESEGFFIAKLKKL